MTIEFSLPDIGEGLDEAEVVEWHVKPGDTIVRDQPFVDLLTDKAQTEMPAPGAGTVVSLGAEVGDVVKVGDVLIVIDDGRPDDVPSPPAGSSPSSQSPPSIGKPTASPRSAPPSPPARRPKASPSTRRLAFQRGIDLATVTGSGPGGRILAADLAALNSPVAGSPVKDRSIADSLTTDSPAAPEGPSLGWMPVGEHELRGIRRATARAMNRSWSTIPHVTAMDEVDATELLLARTRIREALGERGAVITPLSLLLVAVARGLRRFPMLNATLDLDRETITIHQSINIGVAVAGQRGLLVPVVKDADRLGVAAMAAEVARLSAEARAGSITSADLADGTLTVTNYGSNGGYFAAPIIRPGESLIVGFGSIATRPIVVDDRVEARPVLPVVLSADHRLIDGDVLSAFQRELSQSITTAVTLLLDGGPADGGAG